MRLDNLTGDGSLNWLSSAAQQILMRELEGETGMLPGPANTPSDARLQRVTRLVHGYFDRRAGKLHFEISVEDLNRNRIGQSASADGESLDALARLAKQLSPAARPFSTADTAAAAAWGQGDFERAVTLDPDFGAAWLSRVEALGAAGDAAGALEAADQALRRTGLRGSIERAQIRLATAVLRRDDAQREAALKELGPLLPADDSVLRTLAEVEMNSRRFPEAAGAYRDLIRADPADDSAYNMLGYAEALAGNVDAARAAFEQYGRRPGQATNALDSLGESLLVNGRFAEAEKIFLQAYARDPSFLAGDPLRKAAYARWLGGDLAGADQLMERYWNGRAPGRDPVVTWRRATWRYETGRRNEAVLLLMQAPPEAAEIAKKQLAVWSDPLALPRDVAQLKRVYDGTPPMQDGLARTLYAAALLHAGRAEEARGLIARWPLPERSDSLLEASVYPQFLELRKELGR